MSSVSQSDLVGNDHLSIAGVDLVDLCKEYGTPLFVFDEERIKQNYLRFHRAFQTRYPRVIVSYSIKTNSNLAVCSVIREAGAYAEVASELDLQIALKAGFDPKNIILDGSYKPASLLREALERRIFQINVESFTELERLNQIAMELGKDQSIGIRVNLFKKSLFSSETMRCNPSSRFGFTFEDAYSALRTSTRLERLKVNGIMTHPYYGAVERLLPFVKKVHDELGIEIQYLNFGGGFDSGVSYILGFRDLFKDFLRQKIGLKSNLDRESSTEDIEATGEAITSQVRRFFGELEPTIVLEPGRFIVGDAGIFLVSVDHIKEVEGHKWVMVDGGMNLLPVTEERYLIKVANRVKSAEEELVNIAGPIPSSIDVIAIKKRLPKISEGDILAILGCGAYSLSLSNQFLYPRPNVVMLRQGRKPALVREAETVDYVLNQDKTIE